MFPKPAIVRAAPPELLCAGDPALAATFMPGLRHHPRPILTWIGMATSAADGTTYDFGDFTAPSAGLMIVGGWGRNTDGATNRTVSSISVGGTNATLHVNPSGGSNPIALGSRAVAAGDHNVTLTLSATMLRAAVAVWLLTRYAAAEPVDVDGTNNNTTSTSISATLDLAKDGVAVFMHFHNNDAGSFSSATNATTPAEIEGGSIIQPGHLMGTGAVSGHTETVAWGATNRARSIAAASWR